jgi:hypothetical protein
VSYASDLAALEALRARLESDTELSVEALAAIAARADQLGARARATLRAARSSPAPSPPRAANS